MPKPNGSGHVVSTGYVAYGDIWDAKSPDQQIEYLQKLAKSQNTALDRMQKERNLLAARNLELEIILNNANQALDIQRGVVQSMVTANNADSQAIGDRIQELEADVKKRDKVIEDLGGNLN